MGIVTDVILPLSLAFIMFSLGLGLSLSDFTRVFFKPRDFLIGLFFQIIVLPIVALIIVMFWPLSPELAIGVMILAAAPGGVTSNVLTSFAKGNIALSISLTAINSILCVITVPLILMISLSVLDMGGINEGQSLFSIASQMFLIVTIPVIIGVLLSGVLEGDHVHLRLDVGPLEIAQRFDLNLIVEVTNITNDRHIFHGPHVVDGKDVLVAGRGDKDVRLWRHCVDGLDVIAIHGRLQRADRVNF